MNKLDVHHYDGGLHSIKTRLPFPINREISTEMQELNDAKEAILEYCNKIMPELKPTSQNIFRQLLNDYGTNANHDPSNNLRVENFLLYFSGIPYNKDFIELLDLQIEEMQSGMCPQGRTHRLLNAILPFIDFEQNAVAEEENTQDKDIKTVSYSDNTILDTSDPTIDIVNMESKEGEIFCETTKNDEESPEKNDEQLCYVDKNVIYESEKNVSVDDARMEIIMRKLRGGRRR